MDLTAASLPSHLESQHDVYHSKVINQELLIERDALVYDANASIAGTFHCPIQGVKARRQQSDLC